MRWPRDAAKTRDSVVDSLATSTAAMVDGEALDLPASEIRSAMRWALIPRNADAIPPKDITATLRLLSKSSLPMGDLAEPRVTRRMVDALASKLDGTPASADTASRRWRAVNTAIEYAVEPGGVG